ncbi:uncharacterized protein A4U43_C08F32700 [Asparagus officinalis]|nr:uncharacterized protein A4U43_C08F32700 [Asparagus officinalis]
MNQAIAIFLLLLLAAVANRARSKCGDDAVIFTFGDSNSDTGGLIAGLGLRRPPHPRLPLSIDDECAGESLNTSYLSPYLDSLGNTEFRNGANFAVAGSTTLPRDRPFSLHIQVLQFLRFRYQTQHLVAAQGTRNLFNEEKFRKALYVVDIGQNDLAEAFAKGLSYERVVGVIPNVLSEIKTAIEVVYNTGGRNFWVHNTGPLGCLPQKLSVPRKRSNNLDPNGCLGSFNDAARKFNEGLSALCDELSSELKNATIAYTDIYTIKYDLIANHTNYGFKSPIMACCGYGGPPYNYNINITCGNPSSQACQQGLQFINWDGVHYTEAANSILASKILSTDYTKPKLKFDYFCNI